MADGVELSACNQLLLPSPVYSIKGLQCEGKNKVSLGKRFYSKVENKFSSQVIISPGGGESPILMQKDVGVGL